MNQKINALTSIKNAVVAEAKAFVAYAFGQPAFAGVGNFAYVS